MENKEQVESFFSRNRRGILAAIIFVIVVIAGVITTLCILNIRNTEATKKLEAFVETYNSLRPNFSDAENEDVKALLSGLTELGGNYSNYPAARAFSMAGDIYKEQKDWKNAESMWLKSAEKGSKTFLAPFSYYNAGVAATESGNTEQAVEHFQKSIDFADFPSAAHAQF
ncbi:MAG: tetratricopeptide repeat protein, partial [Spirochaetaceae bacterium]|nr:tetratricopeptide repeat protein [Spirochaetaceae bacterium]